jgi:hypothetical protein
METKGNQMIKKVLFLDDMEERHLAFLRMIRDIPDIESYQAWNAKQAINWLEKEKFYLACLDHDLSDEHYVAFQNNNLLPGKAVYAEDTGLTVAQFIALHQDPSLHPDNIITHSWNTDRAKEMDTVLHNTNKYNIGNLFLEPFGSTKTSLFGQLVLKLLT